LTISVISHGQLFNMLRAYGRARAFARPGPAEDTPKEIWRVRMNMKTTVAAALLAIAATGSAFAGVTPYPNGGTQNPTTYSFTSNRWAC
jgi:hypothetical protein